MKAEIATHTENTTLPEEFSYKEAKMVKPFSLDVNEEDKEEKEASLEIALQLQPHVAPVINSSQASQTIPPPSPSISMPPAIEELFVHMASQLILLKTPLENTTIVYLNSPGFANSPFYGTKLIVKEYSTAPLQFNIELATSSKAFDTLTTHQGQLFSAFEHSDFNFSVKNLQVCLNSEEEDRPFFHRKEKTAQDGKDSLS